MLLVALLLGMSLMLLAGFLLAAGVSCIKRPRLYLTCLIGSVCSACLALLCFIHVLTFPYLEF